MKMATSVADLVPLTEVSAAKVKSSEFEKSGFDCEFVKAPAQIFQWECPLCLQILREPYQAPCCGNSFCRVCIERIKTDKKPCPTCNENNFATFHNKGLERTLYQFQVYCSHKKEGCDWNGELGQLQNHLNLNPQPNRQLEGCEYSEINCLSCTELNKRIDIINKAKDNDPCPKCPFGCEYCHDYKSNYEDVINNHYPNCSEYQLTQQIVDPSQSAVTNTESRDGNAYVYWYMHVFTCMCRVNKYMYVCMYVCMCLFDDSSFMHVGSDSQDTVRKRQNVVGANSPPQPGIEHQGEVEENGQQGDQPERPSQGENNARTFCSRSYEVITLLLVLVVCFWGVLLCKFYFTIICVCL